EPTWGMNAVASVARDVYSVGDAGVVMKNGAVHQRLGSLCNFLAPFGHGLLTGGQAGILFDAISGRRIHQHPSPLNCAATFSRDGELKAIVGTYTGEGLVFGLRDGEAAFEREVRLHDNAVKGVAARSGLVFSVSANRAAAFHSTQSFGLVRRLDAAHDRIANGCAAIKHGGFVSVARDRLLRVWTENGVERMDTPHTHSIKCVAASGDFVATGAYDGAIAVLDLRTRRWVHAERPTTWG